MSNAEIMVLKDIDEMSIYHLAPNKLRIQQDIKYAFWHEFICKEKYDELINKVNDKYCQLADKIMF